MKVTVSRVWLTPAAMVKPARPFMTRSVLEWTALLVFRFTTVPVPVTPPWMVRPPAGMTISPGVVGLMFSVPRFTTVPPV